MFLEFQNKNQTSTQIFFFKKKKVYCTCSQENRCQFYTAQEYFIFLQYLQKATKNQNFIRKLKKEENLPVMKFSYIHGKV